MKRTLLVVAVLLTGCGGGNNEKTAAPAETETADQGDMVLDRASRTSRKLSRDLKRTAAVLDRQNCGDEEEIRLLTEEISSSIRTLNGMRDDPALRKVRSRLVDSIATARSSRDDLEDILVAC